MRGNLDYSVVRQWRPAKWSTLGLLCIHRLDQCGIGTNEFLNGIILLIECEVEFSGGISGACTRLRSILILLSSSLFLVLEFLLQLLVNLEGLIKVDWLTILKFDFLRINR